jgi:hypothetical protein
MAAVLQASAAADASAAGCASAAAWSAAAAAVTRSRMRSSSAKISAKEGRMDASLSQHLPNRAHNITTTYQHGQHGWQED